jgi:GT2 family glycosyltransferase
VNRFSEIEVELASMLRDKQQTLEAMHLLRNAIHENPENIAALVMLGEMYEQAGLYDAAVESYTCALAIDGSQLQAHQGMMRSYLALQSWSLARRHANQLPPHFELDLNLGHQVAISCLRDGQTLEAAQRFLKLIEIEPTNLLLRVNLLESLLKLGHRNELVAEWKRMIKMLESARMPLPGTESEELKAVSHLCDQFALVRSEQEVSEYQQIQESLHELMHGHICDISQEFQQEENEPPEIESEGYFDVHVGPLHYATLSTSRFYRHSTTQNHPAASIGIRLPEESRYHRRPLVTVCDSVSRRHYPGSPFLLPGIQHDSPSGVLHRNVQVPEPFLPQHQEPVGKGRPQKPSVAIIIPNKNGAHLLSSLFQSLKRYNSYPNLEIIVVDQQSTDGSIEICEQQSSSFSVKTCSLGEDCSYSELNNTGVSHTKSSLLLFCNNDIIFHQDIIGSMVRYFDDPDIGVLGVRLHDFVPDGSAARSPIQHLGVTFSFNGWDAPTTPIELRYRPELKEIAHTAWSPPAVTAALAMVRKSNFADIGGFSKEYFFGHEDIDLCLAMRRKLGKVSVCANELSAVHHQGASRGEREEEFQVKIQEKAGRLIDTHGYFVRRSHLSSMLTDPFQWRAYPFRIGFAVSTTDLNKNHGDLFTAMELAESLQESYGWETAFISSEEEWYNVTNLDALVVMCHDYKPSCIPHSWPHLLKIAWMRNHFTEWLGSEEQYDLYWSASQSVTETLQEQFSKDALCLPLAANYEKFSSGKPRVEFSSDYCFAGNYWGFPREVVQNLKPSELPFSFKVFGVGWEACPTFSEYCSGPVPYHQLPNVYASTKIVIDDSTVSTRDAGSLNSRVYEALSAGALVVSNIKAVSPEFEMLPTYSTTDELKEHLWRYLSNDKERMELVSRLQSVVQEQCTYQHRAKQVLDALQQHLTTRFRFAVKVAAERSRENKKNRECIIAENLAQALRRAGHLARVDFMEDWHCWQSGADDVAIVVGENFGYRLKPHQINFLIYTSELESIHRIGCEAFDCIFVATEKCVERMKGNEIEAVECLDVSYEMQSRLNEKVVDSLLATVRKCHQEKML